MRVVVAEDAALLREGLVAVLERAGWEVPAAVESGPTLVQAALDCHPDLVVADIRMPPTHTDEGIAAAELIRRARPATSVLLLSQHVELRALRRLVAGGTEGVGYLLKERVLRVEDFLDAASRVAHGGSAIDPEVVGRLLGSREAEVACQRLSPRERDVLALMAEGLGNEAISRRLVVVPKTVDAHISSIFAKLDLDPAGPEHRRVTAVLRWLRDDASGGGVS